MLKIDMQNRVYGFVPFCHDDMSESEKEEAVGLTQSKRQMEAIDRKI